MSTYEPVHSQGDSGRPIGRRGDSNVAAWALPFGSAGPLAVGLLQAARVMGEFIGRTFSARTGIPVGAPVPALMPLLPSDSLCQAEGLR